MTDHRDHYELARENIKSLTEAFNLPQGHSERTDISMARSARAQATATVALTYAVLAVADAIRDLSREETP